MVVVFWIGVVKVVYEGQVLVVEYVVYCGVGGVVGDVMVGWYVFDGYVGFGFEVVVGFFDFVFFWFGLVIQVEGGVMYVVEVGVVEGVFYYVQGIGFLVFVELEDVLIVGCVIFGKFWDIVQWFFQCYLYIIVVFFVEI